MLNQPFFRATADCTGRNRHGRPLTRSGTAISSVSREDAEQRAQKAARDALDRAIEDREIGGYLYGDRLVVEPVLDRIAGTATEGDAIVTANIYGCEVLNTSGMMFVDVDLEQPQEPPLQISFLDRLLGRRPPPPAPPAPLPEQAALDRLVDFLTGNPVAGVRVYRTAAGLRYLFIDQPHDPTSAASENLMRRLGADSKYILLCRAQKCFRARLTPKPWRCGSFSMKAGFADGTDQPNEVYQAWRKDYYDKAAAQFATCRLLTVLGPKEVRRDFVPLVTLHDEATRVTSGLPLA